LKGANIDEIEHVVQHLWSASTANGGRCEACRVKKRIAREMRVRPVCSASTISLYIAPELCISIVWASIAAMASQSAMYGIANERLVRHFFIPKLFDDHVYEKAIVPSFASQFNHDRYISGAVACVL
jgi:hypothetical protein